MFSFLKKRKKKSSPVIINFVDDDYVIDFVLQWNVNYPIDRWWRDKHKVAFNSPEHRAVSFLDMRFEFEEEVFFKQSRRFRQYVPDKGDWLEVSLLEDEGLTEAEKLEKYRKEFESIDLSKYNDE